MVLEKTLGSPLDCKEVKPVNPKETNPSLEGLLVELKSNTLATDVKSWLIGKDPDAGKDWRQKEKGVQKMRWLDSITSSMDMNVSKLQDIVEDRGAWCATVHGGHKQLYMT